MAPIDLVFEGGGAKGMVFVGALDALLSGGAHAPGRLLGTSAGAITAVLVAAGYSPAEMAAALTEKDAAGRPVFAGFLAQPAPFDAQALHNSTLRALLGEIRVPLLPSFAEGALDDLLVQGLAANPTGCHLFSFVELGGWYSADPFVAWLQRKLNEGQLSGQPRQFGNLTLAEFHERTNAELTVVASDTTAARMLLLNHRTAPHLPVVWAARMSMSIPLLWQEVVWQAAWGPYLAWDAAQQRLAEQDVTGHSIVDGGLLSNFPIALFLADNPDVAAVVGQPGGNSVLGLLIDETLPVPGRPPAPAGGPAARWSSLRMVQRLHNLVNTATTAHDNTAIAVFAQHVVRLPAQGYATTEFNMTEDERNALVNAGRTAMQAFLAKQPTPRGMAPGAALDTAPTAATQSLANTSATDILKR